MFTAFRNKGIALVILFGILVSLSGVELQSQEKHKSTFGFVSITTVQASGAKGVPDSFAGGVVVALKNQEGSNEDLVLTDEHGMALAPLRNGKYCAEAFGTDGKLLKLDVGIRNRQRYCFMIRTGQTIEFSLVLSHDVHYSKTVPSLGIQ
jgi:hypothetical protein